MDITYTYSVYCISIMCVRTVCRFIDVLLELLRPDAAILMSSICMKDEYEVPIEELFSELCTSL